MLERVEWQCPACSRRFRIPAGENPSLCHICSSPRAQTAVADWQSGSAEVIDDHAMPAGSIDSFPVMGRRRGQKPKTARMVVAISLGAAMACAIYSLLPRFEVQIQVQDSEVVQPAPNVVDTRKLSALAKQPVVPAKKVVAADAQNKLVDNTRKSAANRENRLEKPVQLIHDESLGPVIVGVAPSIVRITTDRAVGSGFLIDEKGIIVTSFRLIDRARRGIAEFSDGSKAEIVGTSSVNEEKDLAILAIAQTPANARPIQLATVVPLQAKWCLALGRPRKPTRHRWHRGRLS